jgi:metal-responsive CopG/Arc/MetJ family transcriptional regulator
MKGTVTVRLDRSLERSLDRYCRSSGRKRSEVVRDALRRQLSLLAFENLRRQVMPFAEARGYLSDEDVFADVS